MKIFLTLILMGVAVLFSACEQADPNEQVDEGTVEGNIYTSHEIGWTLQIPKGWKIISKDKLEENVEKGKKAIEEVAGELDFSGLKHLISFQKNQFNIFQATSEAFQIEYEGQWEENNSWLKEVLSATYAEQGINIDTSSSQTVIDGIGFEVFHITVYSPEGEIILYQDMYGSYINGFDFGVNLNYNNNRDKGALMMAWKNSTFKKD